MRTLPELVRDELEDQIKTVYTHVQFPSCVYAEITRVEKTREDTYLCNLKILDKTLTVDNRFPEVPFVSTSIPFEKNDIAVVVLLYGDCVPYIIGRYNG